MRSLVTSLLYQNLEDSTMQSSMMVPGGDLDAGGRRLVPANRIETDPCARRSDRPKRAKFGLRAQTGSASDAAGRTGCDDRMCPAPGAVGNGREAGDSARLARGPW